MAKVGGSNGTRASPLDEVMLAFPQQAVNDLPIARRNHNDLSSGQIVPFESKEMHQGVVEPISPDCRQVR